MFDPKTPEKLSAIFAPYQKIVLIGSATGGHVIPLVNLTKLLPTKAYHALVGSHSLEEGLMKEACVPYSIVTIHRVGNGGWLNKLRYICSQIPLFIRGYQVLSRLRKQGYEAIFSKGGPGSIPLTLAGRLLGYTLIIHESDTAAGDGNKLVSRYAHHILSGFPKSIGIPTRDLTPVGQILDPLFYERGMTIHQHSLWREKHLTHILVICGSQGAQSVFEALSKFAHPNRYEFHIILGRLNAHMRDRFRHFHHITLHDWIDQHTLHELLHTSDVIITRGSATTLAEVSTSHAHIVIIPLPSAAHDHQLLNARVYEGLGHTLLTQDRLPQLESTIEEIIKKRS